LEAQLIDITDEIAYNTADLDDGYEAHLLTFDQIREGIPLFAQFLEEVKHLYPGTPNKLQFNEVLRRMLNRWVTDLIENTGRAIEDVDRSCSKAQPTTQSDGGKEQACAEEALHVTLEQVRLNPVRLAGLSPNAEVERRQTKDFLYANLYYSPALEPEKEAAERIITDLFDFWMRHPEKLPRAYQEKAASEALPRVICDYIAGMTDTYISEQFEKQFG
jgi:dGTPase